MPKTAPTSTSLGSGLDSNAPGSFEAPDDATFYTTGGTEYAYIADYWSCDVTIWDASANPPHLRRPDQQPLQ